jgi:spermidine/putrescine transport system permease protein
LAEGKCRFIGKVMLKFIKKQAPFISAVPAILWQFLFLYIPLMFLVSSAFLKKWGVFSFGDFTLNNIKSVLTRTHFEIIGWSFAQAMVIAFLCLLIGYPVAYFFAVKMRRWKNFFLFFLMLPFWTNFLVQAYAWFFILGSHGYLNRTLIALHIIREPLRILYSPYAVILVMIYCYLPFMILPLYGVLEKFDRRLIEASLDLGASSSETFFKVTLPLTMSGVRNGFFLVLVPSFGEYVIPAIMGGGKYFYVGNLISSYFLESGSPSLGAAFTTVSGLFILVAVYLLSWLMAGPTIAKKQER